MDPIRRFVRLFAIRLAASRAPRIALHDVAIRRERVWLTDLDELRHMNNGVYLSLLDHARIDLLLRSGAWKLMRTAGVFPVVTMQTITYRKSLELGDRFDIETKVIGYDERSVYIEQRFVRDGEITARAFVAGRFLRDRGGVATMAELGVVTGVDVAQYPAPDWIAAWADATRLPSTREPAPSSWDEGGEP